VDPTASRMTAPAQVRSVRKALKMNLSKWQFPRLTDTFNSKRIKNPTEFENRILGRTRAGVHGSAASKRESRPLVTSAR
jgi:hypothetical protein